jgi:hypothetical protein
MSVTDAFKTFQDVVNADITHVREARTRRDLFKGAFGTEDDVKEVIASGSLARGTHKDPIHDVDVIVVFDQDEHPEWGSPGSSAADALDHTRERVNTLLGATNGTYDQAVRLARWRNHAVKCFLDDPDDPHAFTVDAMPALRRDGRLLIPEALSEDWVACDPEFLIAEVADRHAQWNKFAGTVRMLNVNQAAAIKQFFVSACYHIEGGNDVADPAGLCGPIQPDIDYDAFADALRSARDNAIKAFQAQANNDAAAAINHWGEVFGDDFPKPPASTGNPAPAVVPAAPRPVKDTPQG